MITYDTQISVNFNIVNLLVVKNKFNFKTENSLNKRTLYHDFGASYIKN